MSRILLVFPLLVLGVHAQGVDGWINQALDPRTGPSERMRLLDQIIAEGGIDPLATRGLEPKNDAEVIHAVVDKLFATNNAVAYIEPLIRLLLTEDAALRAKIARRIEITAEDPGRAQKLQEALDPIAVAEVTHKAHKDPKLRIAAVRALRQIPRRSAVQSIVNAWLRDEDLAVQAECKRVLADVLVPRSADAANAYLTKNTQMTYRDLRDAVFEAQRTRIGELGKFQMEALKHAGAERCFEVLKTGTEEGRKIAANRLAAIVKTRKLGMDTGAFVQKTLEAFARERDREPEAAAAVIRVLKELVRGGDKAPLRGKEAHENLFRALQPLTQKGPKWLAGCLAAVDLLGSLGLPALNPLVEFARDSRMPDVRKAAVNKLGGLARLVTAERDVVGINLATLLEKEQAPDVRRQILFSLKSAPVNDAFGPIRKLLDGNRQKPGTISDSEVEYCIEILRQLGSAAALDELLKLAAKPTKEDLRLYAIRQGLLLRKTTPENAAKILAALEAAAVSEAESEKVRKGIVVALGEMGGPAAYDVLRRLAQNAALAPDAAAATHALVGRFAADAKTVEAAMKAVRERALPGDALEKLIRTILATCETAKRGAADMRYLRAILFAEKHEGSEDERVRTDLLRLLKETVKLAKSDGLPVDLHADACNRYKTMLLQGEPSDEDRRDAIECLIKLAELAGDEKAKAAAHFMEASDVAVKLKDRATAEMLFDKAKQNGAEAAALAELEKRIKAIPGAG